MTPIVVDGQPFRALLASVAGEYDRLAAERDRLLEENRLLHGHVMSTGAQGKSFGDFAKTCLRLGSDRLLQDQHLHDAAMPIRPAFAVHASKGESASPCTATTVSFDTDICDHVEVGANTQAARSARRDMPHPREPDWQSKDDPFPRECTGFSDVITMDAELNEAGPNADGANARRKGAERFAPDVAWKAKEDPEPPEPKELELWEMTATHHEAVVAWSPETFHDANGAAWLFGAENSDAASSEKIETTVAEQNWVRLVSSALTSHDAKEYALRDCWDFTQEDDHKGENMDALRGGGIVTVMEIWGQEAGSQRQSRLSAKVSGGPRSSGSRAADEVARRGARKALQDEDGSEGCCWRLCGFRPRSLILHPLSSKRTAWVCLGLLLISYEAIMLSMEFFPLRSDDFFEVAAFVTTVYWTFDIPLSFLTGIFDKNGEISMKLRVIAKSYVVSWFPLDILLLVINWVLLLIPKDSSTGAVTSVKMVRYTRFLRLVRLAKFERLMSPLLARINSTLVLLGIKSVILLIGVVLWVHLSGCIWFGIGTRTADGWTSTFDLDELSVFQMYLLSTHWAVAQLQGNVEIYAGTAVNERAYAVAYTFASIGVLAAFVSKLTNIMLELQDIKNRKASETRVVCDILSRHKVSTELSLRVRNYLKWKQTVDQKREAETNSVLETLPVELRKALVCEMRSPHVVHHPILGAMRSMHEKTFRRVCSDAMRSHAPMLGETIYSYGERCSTVYVVSAGHVTYLKYGVVAQVLLQNKANAHHRPTMAGKSQDGRSIVKKVAAEQDFVRKVNISEGHWLCEAVLWVRWVHRGDLTVPSQASLLLLDTDKFASIVEEHLSTRQALAMHAVRFAVALDQVSLLFASDLFDTATAVDTLRDNPAIHQGFMFAMRGPSDRARVSGAGTSDCSSSARSG